MSEEQQTEQNLPDNGGNVQHGDGQGNGGNGNQGGGANASGGANANGNPDGGAPGKGAGENGDGNTDLYADLKVELPEGVQMDEQLLTQFKSEAKELGLEPDKAQKLANMYAKRVADANAEAVASHQRQVQDWETEVKNDPEIGGANYEASRETAIRAVDRFGTTELKAFLNETGLGNHPELVKVFHKIGKAIGEGKVITGGESTTGAKDHASILYGNTGS